ncbi:hypothetical protein J6590_035927 [Homalodisca vitripennis]|nr:hypothetical protein J6590_035927 [Homalodisca vitripennis]
MTHPQRFLFMIHGQRRFKARRLSNINNYDQSTEFASDAPAPSTVVPRSGSRMALSTLFNSIHLQREALRSYYVSLLICSLPTMENFCRILTCGSIHKVLPQGEPQYLSERIRFWRELVEVEGNIATPCVGCCWSIAAPLWPIYTVTPPTTALVLHSPVSSSPQACSLCSLSRLRETLRHRLVEVEGNIATPCVGCCWSIAAPLWPKHTPPPHPPQPVACQLVELKHCDTVCGLFLVDRRAAGLIYCYTAYYCLVLHSPVALPLKLVACVAVELKHCDTVCGLLLVDRRAAVAIYCYTAYYCPCTSSPVSSSPQALAV